tara:strand:- start:20934 stop:21209 length:276 start_codon:yes stop_codon:yes gene_type:complete
MKEKEFKRGDLIIERWQFAGCRGGSCGSLDFEEFTSNKFRFRISVYDGSTKLDKSRIREGWPVRDYTVRKTSESEAEKLKTKNQIPTGRVP